MPSESEQTLPDEQWTLLLDSIEASQKGQIKCTPFIGPGVYSEWLPAFIVTAKKWIDEYEFPLALALEDFYNLAKEKYGYPLEDAHQLAMVAQFLAIEKGDDMYPQMLLSKELATIKPPDFGLEEFRNTPYSVLADLKLPLYITTNYDYFMEAALESRGRKPVSEFCRWNEKLYNYAKLTGISSVFDKGKKNYKPSVDQPLVYHLHGVLNIPQSMVLTEKDYFDFAINLNKNDEKMSLPSVIRIALAASFFLFVGYRLEDITFRVIVQGVMSVLGDIQRPKSMAVQLPPSFPMDKRLKVLIYLNSYIKNMFSLYAYWGDHKSFSAELRRRWDSYKSQKV
jgi:SIR2-like domain